MECLLCARHSLKSFTVSHLILINTRQGQRTVLFPFGDGGTGTEWFSVSPGDTGVEGTEEASSGWSEGRGERSGPRWHRHSSQGGL